MGSGKTRAIINFINNSGEEDRFLYITPYLSEVNRIILSCPNKNFRQPEIFGSKLEGIKHLIKNGENVVSTHKLFSLFDAQVLSLVNKNGYILVVDEVLNVIEPIGVSIYDYSMILEKYAVVENGFVCWKCDNYHGEFEELKNLSLMDGLAVNGNAMLKLFPVSIFRAFREIYLLTYLFEAQPQKYFFNYYNIKYKKLFVEGNTQETFRLTDCNQSNDIDLAGLIHISDHKKINQIGKSNHALSKTWYLRSNQEQIVQLKNNCTNFFRNIRKTKSNLNLWTTFKDYRTELSGRGYTKGFLACNTRATNDYKECNSVAYLVNKYMNPYIKNFFISQGVQVNEDMYALSEMLQFIWRSAIRDGKEIWIYIPSSRMRNLLKGWIDEQGRMLR